MRLHSVVATVLRFTVAAIAVAATAAAFEPFVTSGIAAQTGAAAVNLKVLPKETSLQELYKVMGGMQHDLGVECGFCHEQDPDTKQINYASDENPRKETARIMMRMTNDINSKYLGQLGDRQYSPPITCGNCHLGQMHPPSYDPGVAR